ncbi:MAG: prefoldin subunit [Candidatus Diapherotrites archaeon]
MVEVSEINKLIQEFERNRVQLSSVEAQSQSLSLQSNVLEEAIKQLKESKEEKVYKSVGPVLFLSEAKKVQKELEDQKETVDLRLKTLKKQEEVLLDKLNKLKAEIEALQKQPKEEKEEK